MKKYYFIFIISHLFLLNNVFAQNGAIKLWEVTETITSKEYGKYYKVAINTANVQWLLKENIKTFTTEIENSIGNFLVDFELVDFKNPRIKKNNKEYVTNIKYPKMYKGRVKGMQEKNNCMLTISDNFTSAQFILPKYGIEVKQQYSRNEKELILTNSTEVVLPKEAAFDCGTKIDDKYIMPQSFDKNTNEQRNTTSSIDKCVEVFIDCTDSLYYRYRYTLEPFQETINNIYAIWNDLHTAYLNEQINVGIAEINVWTTTTPFTLINRDTALQTFADYYQNNFFGNMAILLDFSTTLNGRSGIAGGFGKAKSLAPNVCGTYSSGNTIFKGGYLYADLNYFGSYSNFPNSSIQREVYLCVHELGHLLGSIHTHNCGWLLSAGPPIVFGALDNCSPTEGGCPMGAAPVNGGTFMSYCIGPGSFMNFNNGFGPLPGSVIRNFVANNTCLTNCDCTANKSVGNIFVPGFYHYEASNQVTANGILPAANSLIKLDGGTRVLLTNGFKAPTGSKVQIYNDGCGGNR
jgi:hypothetical protein